ncbi:hypothetical protein [Alcanivorax sp. MD8A]|uniref:hypothetical protein n=1 Tax=Alcanivorax sp. MD8A TaxID=1177157 RepID=UPI001304D584|nr:hypothetical protein [Alcanivorax sp. MD8A]
MHTIMGITVGLVALCLLAAGLYYHARRNALQSDPILIGSCYLSGAGLLLGNWLVPML